jgi:hypothetical protein
MDTRTVTWIYSVECIFYDVALVIVCHRVSTRPLRHCTRDVGAGTRSVYGATQEIVRCASEAIQ